MKFCINKVNCGKNEVKIIFLLVLLIWLKVFSVDYHIADILNWPLFGLMGCHILRHSARALAVGLPSMAAILCVIVPVSMLPARWRGCFLVVFDFLFSLLAITDILFIRYYSDIFIFHDLMLIPQTGLIVKSIWSLLQPCDLLMVADIPVILWLFLSKRLSVTFSPLTRLRVATSLIIVVISIAVQLITGAYLAMSRPNIINAMYDRLSVCAWTGVETFHWGDVMVLARKAFDSDQVSTEKVREIRNWFSQHDSVLHRPMARGANLILVQCESLQYFVIGLRINGVEVTPNLNRFTRECVYFTNCWSQTAGGQSSDSEFMANTGMFPASSGAAYTRFADDSYNSLARNIRAKGYRAVVFQGTYSAFWNCHRMHPKLRFEKQYSRNTFPNDEVLGLGLSDKAIFTETLDNISRFRTPFYAFVVTLTSHHPFDFAGLDDGTLPLPPGLKGTLLGNYLISIHYFDKQFGMFVEGLRARKLLDKSLLVVYGDHPAIPIAYKQDLEKLLDMKIEEPVDWNKTRRVPLMFRLPGRHRVAGVSKTDTGQMDIFPTVVGLMGLDADTYFGKDLFAENGTEPVIFRNGSYILNGIFVEPAVNRATRIADGAKLNADEFSRATEDVERRLGYSDLILEHNLIEEILR